MRARLPRHVLAGLTLAALCLGGVATPSSAAGAAAATLVRSATESSALGPDARPRWTWPVTPPRITAPYRAPAHAYGPGHRGIDLAAAVGDRVVAPDDGVVAFAGRVVDRGVITIDHGDGVVSTLEPVDATVVPGAIVRRGQPVGVVATGGHTRPGELHLGAREGDAYVNPLRFLSALPRAVLLPCCGGRQEPG